MSNQMSDAKKLGVRLVVATKIGGGIRVRANQTQQENKDKDSQTEIQIIEPKINIRYLGT
jgi:hypothetical protein